ncbi:unnamed protein product, partial [Symbiodinium microadriaticum]
AMQRSNEETKRQWQFCDNRQDGICDPTRLLAAAVLRLAGWIHHSTPHLWMAGLPNSWEGRPLRISKKRKDSLRRTTPTMTGPCAMEKTAKEAYCPTEPPEERCLCRCALKRRLVEAAGRKRIFRV